MLFESVRKPVLLSVPDVLKYASVFGVTASTVDADMVHTIPEADLKNKIFEDRYLDEDKRYTDGWKIDAVKTGGGGTVPILLKYFHEEENNAVLTLKNADQEPGGASDSSV